MYTSRIMEATQIQKPDKAEIPIHHEYSNFVCTIRLQLSEFPAF